MFSVLDQVNTDFGGLKWNTENVLCLLNNLDVNRHNEREIK